eukprot:gene32125-38859_t
MDLTLLVEWLSIPSLVFFTCADIIHDQSFAGGDDIVLMKYASNGTRLWTRLSGSENSDSGQAVALDGAGSVFLAGIARGDVNGEAFSGDPEASDMVIVQYSSDNSGALVWTKLLGVANYNELAFALALHNGTIYLAGSSDAPTLYGDALVGSADAVLVEVSAGSGEVLAVRREGAAGADVGANAVVVDAAGDAVYWGGYTDSSLDAELYLGGAYDMFVAKYALGDGQRVWTRLAGTAAQDELLALALDATAGDVYAVGVAGASLDGQ